LWQYQDQDNLLQNGFSFQPKLLQALPCWSATYEYKIDETVLFGYIGS
jgi:hypothetical protein